MNRREHAKMIGTQTEDAVISILLDKGYKITKSPYPRDFDIVINGTLRVEIKGALWTKHHHSKGRYQFCIHQAADVFILGCMTHEPHFFVVPTKVIGKRKNVAIWSEFPSKYVGRWSQYCDAWHIIDQELA